MFRENKAPIENSSIGAKVLGLLIFQVAWNLSLDAHHLLEGGHHFNQVGLAGHHLFNRFVSTRNFIQNPFVFAAFYACSLLDQVVEGVGLFGFGARHAATGTVAAGAVAGMVAFTFDDIRFGSHRTGDDAVVGGAGTNSSFAGDVDLFAEVGFLLGVVVVAVDGEQGFGGFTPGEVGFDDVLEAGHHDVAVVAGVVLRPLQVVPVGGEFGGALDEVG